MAKKKVESIRKPYVEDLGCNGKAYRIDVRVGDKTASFCLSYETIVASVDEDGKPHLFNKQSNTTIRHVNEFFSNHGWPHGFYKTLELED